MAIRYYVEYSYRCGQCCRRHCGGHLYAAVYDLFPGESEYLRYRHGNGTVVTVDAVNDSGTPLAGAVGGTSLANVLVNDTLNGAPATTSNVTITTVGTWPTGVTLNTTTGAVSVAAGTAANTYTPQYQICSQTNPTICDTATVTVPVYAPPTVAKIFMPAAIAVGGISSMQIVVTNPAGNPGNLTGVSISDSYTGTLKNNAAGSVVCSGAGSATLTVVSIMAPRWGSMRARSCRVGPARSRRA